MGSEVSSHADPPAGHGSRSGSQGPPGDPGDAYLAEVLIRMWMLASGRTLPRDVPITQLDEDELINFWADDMSGVLGRHALPRQLDRTARTRPSGTAVPVRQQRSRNRQSSQTGGRRQSTAAA